MAPRAFHNVSEQPKGVCIAETAQNNITKKGNRVNEKRKTACVYERAAFEQHVHYQEQQFVYAEKKGKEERERRKKKYI